MELRELIKDIFYGEVKFILFLRPEGAEGKKGFSTFLKDHTSDKKSVKSVIQTKEFVATKEYNDGLFASH